MTLEELQKLCVDEEYLGIDELPPTFDLVEGDDWIQDGKYQVERRVYFDNKSSSHYAIQNSRFGSYDTDYYYQMPSIEQVKRVVKTIVVTEYESA